MFIQFFQTKLNQHCMNAFVSIQATMMGKVVVTDANTEDLYLSGLNPLSFPYMSPIEEQLKKIPLMGTRYGRNGVDGTQHSSSFPTTINST